MFASLMQKSLQDRRNLLGRNQDCFDLSYDAICTHFLGRIQRIFKYIDLNYPGLEAVQAPLQSGNLPAACAALMTHFQQSDKSNRAKLFSRRTQSINPDVITIADAILEDRFTFQLATGTVLRTFGGSLNWSTLGPNRDPEWAWFLNRHYHLLTLLDAFHLTGDTVYLRCLNIHLLDWILACPCPSQPQIWAQWRGLEVAYRVLHWASIFYELQTFDALTPLVRLLMLSSLLDHAFYLRWLHDWGDNWVCREMNGLVTFALAWPEFKQASPYLDYAKKHLQKIIREQIYPDGAHKELTGHYHRIVLRDLQNITNLLSATGHPVSETCKLGLERMWNYLACTLRPQGQSLLNNDSDQEDFRPLLIAAAKLYQRSDWLYIASNTTQGTQSPEPASVVFPWAGQFLMRSGHNVEAQWASFDFGPLGANYHGHQDKLHISVNAYGRDLLVDAGRFSYLRNDFWRYFRGSASHNVILIDGQGQSDKVKEWQQPTQGNYLIAEKFDFVLGTCEQGFRHLPGRVQHSRAIIYLRGHYWVVVDQITTDRQCQIQPLWHFYPECTLQSNGIEVVSVDPNVGNLRIVPIANFPWNLEIVKGQQQPVQGWWSREYGHLSPSPTAIYQAEIATTATFAWVLLPALDQVPTIQIQSLLAPAQTIHLQITLPGRPSQEVIMQMDERQVTGLENGWKFWGKCAILQPDSPPLIAYGQLRDGNGKLVGQHPSVPVNHPPS